MQVSSSSKSDSLSPDSVAYRPTPIRYRGLKSNVCDGINGLLGRPEKINREFVYTYLNEFANEIHGLEKLVNLDDLNEVNRMLSVISSRNVQLVDASTKASVNKIRLFFKNICEQKGFVETNPLDFADADPSFKEVSLWELFLQIRGRCLQLELLYDIKHGTVSQLKELEGQVRELLEENNRLSVLLESEKGVSETLRSEHAKDVEAVRRSYQSELEDKDLKFANAEKELGRARGQVSSLVQENIQLKSKAETQEARIAELEEKLARLQRGSGAEKEVVVQEKEVVQEVENKGCIRALERENKQLKKDLEYYQAEASDAEVLRDRLKQKERDLKREQATTKKLGEEVEFFLRERSEVLALSERVEVERKERKQKQFDKLEELAEVKEKLQKIKETVNLADQAYISASASDAKKLPSILYSLLVDLVEMLSKK